MAEKMKKELTKKDLVKAWRYIFQWRPATTMNVSRPSEIRTR